jgi:hypothetical protein
MRAACMLHAPYEWFAHSHKDDVADGFVFERVKELFAYLSAHQIAFEAHRTGRAERARHSAADL